MRLLMFLSLRIHSNLMFFIAKEFADAFGSTGMSTIRNSKSDINMKIFDWKKRQDFEKYEIPEG